MTRRVAKCLMPALCFAMATTAAAQQSSLTTQQASAFLRGTQVDLKTELEKGLRARRPVEFAYLAQVVKLVDEGKLPRPLVESTFAWARVKPTRQLQYFEFALASRARKLHIHLPTIPN